MLIALSSGASMSKSSRKEADTLFGVQWCNSVISGCSLLFVRCSLLFWWQAHWGGRAGGTASHFSHPVQNSICTTAGVNRENSTPLSQPYNILHHSWKPARQPAIVLCVFHYLCYTLCCSFSSANVWRCCIMAQALRDVIFYIRSTVQMGLGM